MVSAIIWPLLRLAFFTALVRGGFLWLEQSHQIYVDRRIAAMIGAAESVAVQAPSWVGLTLAGTVGLLAMTIWEVAKYRGWFSGQPFARSRIRTVRPAFVFTWHYRPEDRDWVPFRRTILLKEAALLAYEKLRGRSVSGQKLPAMAADIKFGGEAKPLSWFGHAILGRGDIPVFGAHPPSTELEIVPKSMTKASGALSDDANSIHYFGEKTPEYIDLTIKRVDFRRRLKEITSWHG